MHIETSRFCPVLATSGNLTHAQISQGSATTRERSNSGLGIDDVRFSDEIGLHGAESEGLDDERTKALADSFGGGLKTLVNPSAALERDCAEVLAAAGEQVPADIDTRTAMVAAPCGGGCLQSVAVTGQLELRGGTPALHTLESNAQAATQSYKGKLPPKVQRHLELARSAAQRLGSEPSR